MMKLGMDIGSETVKTALLEDGTVIHTGLGEVRGRPIVCISEMLKELVGLGLLQGPLALGVTGGAAVSLGGDCVDEFSALAAAFSLLAPEVRTVVEMGRETQKFIRFGRSRKGERLVVEESSLGGKCAAGSGSFLDYMFRRLNYPTIEEFADIACRTEKPATLSGRCAVFTESDIVHLYQKGTPRERIAAGIHQAICRNYRSCIARGKEFIPPVALVGGVAANQAVRRFLAEETGLRDEEIIVPRYYRHMGAIGAALKAETVLLPEELEAAVREQSERPFSYAQTEPLRLELSTVMPSGNGRVAGDGRIALAALGIDIGSVSTKAALITRDEDGRVHVLASFYRKTDGDPLAAVRDVLGRIAEQASAWNIERIVAGTTGSGRYLTGDYVGADIIKNEITAQANGTMAFLPDTDTILEIGGQDSKYIRLRDGVVVDFEMNKACAAGCGAFLEKQAGRLNIPIEEFGETALRGGSPVELDWNCTVFTESAIAFYQQNNVPVEDLCAAICQASVKNYLHKNIGNRSLGEKIVFQGAVAFNSGMVAAFETMLGRPVVVPPYPHLTGAVGVASLAWDNCPAEVSFKGFARLAEAVYTVSSFECSGCANNCDVNTFEMEGGPRYFYNDRCEKFSAVHKKRTARRDLPDLFAEREEMLLSAWKGDPAPGAPRVGIPRGLMFADYYPLFAAFFGSLGLEVVVSEETSKAVVREGVRRVMSEPCYPMKVAHGHFASILARKVDYIFYPGVINTESDDRHLKQTFTCPYVQAAPEVVAAAFDLHDRKDIRLLAPRFFFRRGERHLRRVLRETAAEMGFKGGAVTAAIDRGLEELTRFREAVSARGREIYESLGENEKAFVVIGRPYTLHDRMVNMDIGRKIADLDMLAIPMDFLPLSAERSNDVWPNIYSRQIQKKLAAAGLLRKDSRLQAIVLTYFACGPDAFANIFFRERLGAPCYVMQLDEHTADAGVITRLEAFADTVKAESAFPAREISAQTTPLMNVRGKRLWLPYASEGARVLAAVLGAHGIDARVLPISSDEGLNLARKQIAEDVCLPTLCTMQDMIERVLQSDFDPDREAFFQGSSEGPCRYGMYHMLQKNVLSGLGRGDVDMVTLGSADYRDYGTSLPLLAWDALVAHDMLEKMLHHCRPCENIEGSAEEIYRRRTDELALLVPAVKELMTSRGRAGRVAAGRHLAPLRRLIRAARDEFAVARRAGDLPLVGLVGEFYVRIHRRANLDVIRKVEGAGVEVWLAPMTEFFGYSNLIGGIISLGAFMDTWRLQDLKDGLSRQILAGIAARDEHLLFQENLPFMEGFDDIRPGEVVARGAAYIHPSFGGEAICSMGKADDFAARGLDGVISVIPFNCMPGNIVASLGHELRRRHDNIPFLSLDYDGFVDMSRDARLAAFMAQVRDAWQERRGHGPAPFPDRRTAEMEVKVGS